MSLPGAALCGQCDFIKFGTWTSEVSYGKNPDKMGGWWVATDQPVSVSDLPTRGSAFYEGSAVGTFAKRDDGAWSQGVATGDVSLNWNFTNRKGKLRVTDFGTDELGRRSFSGKMERPLGAVSFAGDITKGATGVARGTFAGPRPGLAPKRVIGDFGVRGPAWRANGIYGAHNLVPL